MGKLQFRKLLSEARMKDATTNFQYLRSKDCGLAHLNRKLAGNDF
jgi:hypothetical protein